MIYFYIRGVYACSHKVTRLNFKHSRVPNLITESELKHKLARFGDHELDCSSGRLTTKGQDVNLEPLVFQFLLLLIQHHGDVVSKKVVLASLWPNKSPSDEALRAMVKKAREVLKDNARNPTYIKTIPTKGYMLIPNVVLTSTIVQTWFQQNKSRVLIASLVVTTLSILLLFVYSYNKDTKENIDVVSVEKTEMTQFGNSKVSAHYLDGALINIRIESNSEANKTTVIWDDFTTKKQVRLTVKVVLGSEFWWSDQHEALLVTRKDGLAVYVIEPDFDKTEPVIIEYKLPEKLQSKVLGFGFSSDSIYLFNREEKQIEVLDLAEATRTPYLAIEALGIKVEQISGMELFAHPENESFMLVTQFENSFSLFQVENKLTTTNIKAVVEEVTNRLGTLQSVIWNKEGTRLSFTDEQGQLFSFQVSTNRITSWNTGGEQIITLVADCGDTCFIISDTQGLSKIVQILNPFENADKLGFTSSLNSNTNIETLPYLSDSGMYFVSETKDSTQLMLSSSQQNLSVIYDFDKQSIIDEFIVNESADSIVGLLNQRPFSLNLITEELEYLSIAFPKISHLRFNLYGNIEFYAQPSNDPAGLYEYDISNKQVSLKHKGMLQVIPLVLLETAEGGQTRFKANLMINENKQAQVVFQNNKPAVKIDLLDSTCPSCFQIMGNYLYKSSHNANSSLTRINLLTGEVQTHSLYIEELRRRFSLSADGKSMALMTRQDLQTKLIRVEGLIQVY